MSRQHIELSIRQIEPDAMHVKLFQQYPNTTHYRVRLRYVPDVFKFDVRQYSEPIAAAILRRVDLKNSDRVVIHFVNTLSHSKVLLYEAVTKSLVNEKIWLGHYI